MDPSDVADKARLDGQHTPPHRASLPMEQITAKNSYAHAISSSPKSAAMDVRQLKESVKATHTTHNGVPAVMFKASDYYGIMAAECRFTMQVP